MRTQLQHRMPAVPTEQFIPSVARQRHGAVLGHFFGQGERGQGGRVCEWLVVCRAKSTGCFLDPVVGHLDLGERQTTGVRNTLGVM